MNGATPRLWAGPLRYWRWAARERPGLFWAVIIGGLGPVTLAVVPPLRHALGRPGRAAYSVDLSGSYRAEEEIDGVWR